MQAQGSHAGGPRPRWLPPPRLAVLYISSELEEVLAVGDRIGVLSECRIVDVVDRADADLERIGLALAGARAHEEIA